MPTSFVSQIGATADTDVSSRLIAATSRIFDALSALRQEFGVETLLIVTRGDVKQQRFTRVHASPKTSSFLRSVIRLDAGHIAEKLEGYVVSGAADNRGGFSAATAMLKQKEQIKAARDFILNGLVDTLRDNNMPEDQIPKSMNYKSYETKIVNQCGVVLVGYPGDKGIVNPGDLDASILKELLARLDDGRCHWKTLSKEELEHRRLNGSHIPNTHGDEISAPHSPGSSSDTSCSYQGELGTGGGFIPVSPDPVSQHPSPSSEFRSNASSPSPPPSTIGAPTSSVWYHDAPEFIPNSTQTVENFPMIDSAVGVNLQELTNALHTVLTNYHACVRALGSYLPFPPQPNTINLIPQQQTWPSGQAINPMFLGGSNFRIHDSFHLSPQFNFCSSGAPTSPTNFPEASNFVFGNMDIDASEPYGHILREFEY